jgi:hypothetical protein
MRTDRVMALALAGTLAGVAGCSGSSAPSGATGGGGGGGVTVQVSPSTADVLPGGSVSFTATVRGAADTSVRWSVTEPGGGTVDASGRYVAPQQNGAYHVVAQSVASPSATATASVRVTATPAVRVTVSPGTVSIAPGQTATFRASVTGATDTSVDWSVRESSGCGSVSTDGTYAAPPAPAACHVVATSRADVTAAGSAFAIVATRTSGAVPLGVNSFYMSDYEPQHFFADIMRQAQPWNVVGDTHTQAPRDADGWPTGDAEIILLIGLGGRPQPGAAGVYRLSFRGEATIRFTGGPSGSAVVRNQAYDPVTGRTTADLDVSPQNTSLILAFRGQAGGIKDLRVMRPGHDPSEVFSQLLLERIRLFSTLRFMDWLGPPSGGMNSNAEASWSDRTVPGYAIQARAPDHGAAWEWIILLANAARKDVWINVPYLATDEYVTKLAQLFRYGSDGVEPYTSPQSNPVFPPLDPDLKLYVEHGNELWNGIFEFARRNEADAAAEVAAGDPHHLAWDGSTNGYYHAFRRMGWLAVRDANLFRAVFGDAEMGTRVRPVLAAQIGNAETARQGLRYIDAVHGPANPFGNPGPPVSWYIHAIAGAPYIEAAGARSGMTVDDVIAGMRVHLETRLYPQMDAWIALAGTYGIQATNYEGGQGLIPDVSADAMLAAQSDPRMKDLIVDLLHRWYGRGGGLFMYYALCSGYTQYGFWGLSDDFTSEATPKWDAIKQVAAGL